MQEPAQAPKATSIAWSAATESPCPDAPPRAVDEPSATEGTSDLPSVEKSAAALSSTAKARLTQQIAFAHDPRRATPKHAATPPNRWLGRKWPDKATQAVKANVATPEAGGRESTLEPEVIALLQALPAPNRGQLPPRTWGEPESRNEVYRLLKASAKAAAAAEYELALRGYLRAFKATRAPPLLLSVARMHLRLGQGHARPATAKVRLLTLSRTRSAGSP